MAAAAPYDREHETEAGFAAIHSLTVEDPSTRQELSRKYAGIVAGMREVFDSGRTKVVEWRREQLQNLIKGIRENTEFIAVATAADLGGPKLRPVLDMAPIISDAEYALGNLSTWTKPRKVSSDIPADFMSSFTVRPEPKGVTLNIAPWNFPICLSFEPLVAAIAAGNCMIIKPSELSPHCADVIQFIVEKYLDPDCIKVIKGAVNETQALLDQRWDHIMYTGNGVIARTVMEAAAKHITPVTLELGGKSPVLVDETANMAAVVNRVFGTKSMNQGQICVAPDYVIIHETRCEEFISAFTKQVASSKFGEGSKDNPNWGNIINENHVERLRRLIDTSGGKVRSGGSADIDAKARHVPLTVIEGPDLDAPVMHEEVFGPILPVIPVKNMDEGIRMIKDRERPLALYVFSQDAKFQERVLSECPSGGAAVNSAMEHMCNKRAPFGGTGASGMGKYHGKDGFDEFSHYRTILYKKGSQPMLPPVEKQPAWFHDAALKMLVTGFVSPETKQKVKMAGAAAFAAGAAVLIRSRL